MNELIKKEFQEKLGMFFKKAIHQINNTRKKHKQDFTIKKNIFSISGNTHGDKKITKVNTKVIRKLYKYNNHFKFKEAEDVSYIITENNIFNQTHNTIESNIENRILNLLEDYIEIRGGFSFSKISFDKFYNDLIKGIESKYIDIELVFILPNLKWSTLKGNNILLENGFYLKNATAQLKTEIVNSFIKSTIDITSHNVYYQSVVETEIIIYKRFLIIKGNNEINNYSRGLGMYPHGDILREIHAGVECIKKISIYLGGHVYISNAFFRDGDTEKYIKTRDWQTDRHIDFFAPNLMRTKEHSFNKSVWHFKRFYNKFLSFKYQNFPIVFQRYISALEQDKNNLSSIKDLNHIIDYIIMLESLVVNSNHEVSFQFSLICSCFFGKKNEERKKLFIFFKRLYQLRSDILHGNETKTIKGTLKKLKDINPTWRIDLKNYCHEIILFIINNNIENKGTLINLIKAKLPLPQDEL